MLSKIALFCALLVAVHARTFTPINADEVTEVIFTSGCGGKDYSIVVNNKIPVFYHDSPVKMLINVYNYDYTAEIPTSIDTCEYEDVMDWTFETMGPMRYESYYSNSFSVPSCAMPGFTTVYFSVLPYDPSGVSVKFHVKLVDPDVEAVQIVDPSVTFKYNSNKTHGHYKAFEIKSELTKKMITVESYGFKDFAYAYSADHCSDKYMPMPSVEHETISPQGYVHFQRKGETNTKFIAAFDETYAQYGADMDIVFDTYKCSGGKPTGVCGRYIPYSYVTNFIGEGEVEIEGTLEMMKEYGISSSCIDLYGSFMCTMLMRECDSEGFVKDYCDPRCVKGEYKAFFDKMEACFEQNKRDAPKFDVMKLAKNNIKNIQSTDDYRCTDCQNMLRTVSGSATHIFASLALVFAVLLF